MTEIALTAALRSNLLTLQNTQNLLDRTQNRLATGRSVNSALDDATAFFAAQGLSNRATDLGRVQDGLGQSIQVLQTADQGITSLSSLVEQARSIAISARDAGGGSAEAVGTVDLTVDLADNDTVIQGNLTGAATGDSFTIGVDGGPAFTIALTATTTVNQLIDQLNAIDNIQAEVTPGNALSIRTTNGGVLNLTDDATNPLLADFGITDGNIAPSGALSATDRAQFESDFTEILTQIDALVLDTSFRGTNLLNGGTLITDFNEDGTNQQTITGVTFDSAGLGIGAADFSSGGNINTSINAADAALDTLRNQARTFGSFLNVIQTREDFTSNLINTLQEGADRLTLADQNEEGANLLALQTRQQLGVTALSLASQSQQAVLSLF